MQLQNYIFVPAETSRTIHIALESDQRGLRSVPKLGLTYQSSGLKAYYRKGGTGVLTEIPLATQTVDGAWSSGGFVEIDSVNAPGLYRFDIPNELLTTVIEVWLEFSGPGIRPTIVYLDGRFAYTVAKTTITTTTTTTTAAP